MENIEDKEATDRFIKQWAECVNEWTESVNGTSQESYKKDIKLFMVNSKFNKLNKRRQKKFLKTAPHVVLQGAYPINISDKNEDGKMEIVFNYDNTQTLIPVVAYNHFVINDKKE